MSDFVISIAGDRKRLGRRPQEQVDPHTRVEESTKIRQIAGRRGSLKRDLPEGVFLRLYQAIEKLLDCGWLKSVAARRWWLSS